MAKPIKYVKLKKGDVPKEILESFAQTGSLSLAELYKNAEVAIEGKEPYMKEPEAARKEPVIYLVMKLSGDGKSCSVTVYRNNHL